MAERYDVRVTSHHNEVWQGAVLKVALGIGVALLAGAPAGGINHDPDRWWLRPVNYNPYGGILPPPEIMDGDTPSKQAAPYDEKTMASLLEANQADSRGDYSGAIAILDRAIARDPKNAPLMAGRGFIRLRMGDLAGAGRDIDEAAKLSPHDPTIRSVQASLYLAKGQMQDALDIADDLIRENPNDPGFFLLRSRIRAMRQDKQMALADLDAALRLAPDAPEIHLDRAEIFGATNDWSHALAEADEFLHSQPDSFGGHLVRAFALSGVGRHADAVREFDIVIAAHPSAAAYFGRAWSRSFEGGAGVMADLESTLKMDSNFGAAYRMQGMMYFNEGNFPSAIKALSSSVRLAPNDNTAFRKLAASYAGNRQYDAAINALDEMLINHPANMYLLMDRCRYKAMRMKSLDDALADCDQAAKVDPISDEVREVRAFAYQRFGQTGKAVEAYKDILSRRPNSAIVHFGLAVAESAANSPAPAWDDFIAARVADPGIDGRMAIYLSAPRGYEFSNPRMMAQLAAANEAHSIERDRTYRKAEEKAAAHEHSSRGPVSIVKPNYPAEAEDNQISGYVDFEFIVQPDGSVGHPVITCEAPEGYGFADAATKVFPKWKFTPEIQNGAPIPSKAFYRFSFKLR